MKTKHLLIGLLPILISIPGTIFHLFQEHYTGKKSISAKLESSSDLPVVYFNAKVDQLRIRKNPDLNAAVIAEVPEGGRLQYLHKIEGAPIEVTLRGIKQRGRWYKVAWSKDNDAKTIEGWVFTGGIALSSIELSGDPESQLNFSFLKATKLSKATFDAQALQYKNDFKPNPTPNANKKGPITLPLNNGKVKIISDSLCKNGGPKSVQYDQHHYIGQFPGLGMYLMSTGCQHSEMISYWNYLVRKSDGEIVLNNMEYDVPMLSSDGQKMASPISADCGAVLGVDFYFSINNKWNMFSIICEDQQAEKVIWSQDSKQCLLKWNLLDDAGEKTATRYYSFSFGPLE